MSHKLETDYTHIAFRFSVNTKNAEIALGSALQTEEHLCSFLLPFITGRFQWCMF